jgi:signal transduction histidine kinase
VVQVLSNLIDNALKFTPRQGRIKVSGQIMNDSVLCAVSDTGPGIPPGIRARVFDRFVQAEGGGRSGRGLGLYIAKGLIEAQAGSIWVDSQEGRGTTFSFTLPLAPATEVDRSGATMETTRGSLGPGPIVGSR